MTQEQLKTFITSCLSFARSSHFDNERYVKKFLSKSLKESTFTEIIVQNYKIANNMHFGVCFTMACWAYNLLYTMGIDFDYYILEVAEKQTGFPHYVLLYKAENEYKICDLSTQVKSMEEINEQLFIMSKNVDKYDEGELKHQIKKLSDSKYLCQNIDEFFKNYNGGYLFYSNGIDDDRLFSDIPRVPLQTFLKNEKVIGKHL